jgi:hypothetical protein
MWRLWGRIEECTGCWWGSLRERAIRETQDVDGRIILRWIFRKLKGVVGTGWSWLRIGYGEELSSSINAGNFLTSCKVYC